MSRTTISSKNQITIPKRALNELGLKAGSTLIVRPYEHKILLEPRPKSLTKYYKGLGKKSWKKLGGGEKYLKRERGSWEPKNSKKR